MDTTLFLLGITCIIAALVGGGLKAVNFEFPVINSPTRQIALAVLGIILMGVSRLFVPAPPPPPTAKSPEYPEIDYHQRGSSFVIIGPNPGGVFARSGYWWNEDEEAGKSSQYRHLRYLGGSACQIEYKPN
jgi:hypothetical protein